MKLKKINAVLSLLSVLTLLIHVGYCTFAYFTLYYNPTLKTLTALPFMVLVCLHAICGMCSVFLQNDGTQLDTYQKQNRGTVIQRVSAALIFPLLILHIKAFDILKNSSSEGKWFLFGLIIFLQILFFAVVFLHTAVSFSRAFITLGLLTDRKKQKTMDRIVCILCTVIMIVTVVATVRGELTMFVHG